MVVSKKDTYFFSHDATAKDDPKIMVLIDQLGLEGYGIFWVVVETLRTQPDYKCPLKMLPSLARRYNTTAEKMNAVVKSYELFIIENDEVFFSDSLNRRMAIADAKRQKLSEAGKRGALIKSALPKPPLSHPEATLKQLKEIKGKETKRKVFTAPTESEVIAYFLENGYTRESASKAFKYYSANNWNDKNGTPVNNWKQKMIGNWFKPENKTPQDQKPKKQTVL